METILDQLEGPSGITRVFINERERQGSQRGRCDDRAEVRVGERLEDAMLLALKMQEGAIK